MNVANIGIIASPNIFLIKNGANVNNPATINLTILLFNIFLLTKNVDKLIRLATIAHAV